MSVLDKGVETLMRNTVADSVGKHDTGGENYMPFSKVTSLRQRDQNSFE